jgi:hypothetical protein
VSDGWKRNFADDLRFGAGLFADGTAVAGEILT